MPSPGRGNMRSRCPLLTVPMAIIYAVKESQGTAMLFPRMTGGAMILLCLVVSSRRILPAAMQLLVIRDREKVRGSGGPEAGT